jgi:hypothetical protein
MEAGLEQRELPAIDKRQTTSWAIASVGGGGFIVGYSVFLLVNRETGREHQIHIPTGGLSTYFGVASASSPSYTTFETSRAVSFADFDHLGVRLTTANIGVVLGYSIVYLTIFDGPACLHQDEWLGRHDPRRRLRSWMDNYRVWVGCSQRRGAARHGPSA